MNNVNDQLQEIRNSVQILADNLTLKGIESSPNDGLTALTAKVLMVGGGGVMTLSLEEAEENEGNCYLVKTIDEMNLLSGMEANQYCLVYDDSGDEIIFTNAYIYSDDPETDTIDMAWRIIEYGIDATAAEVYKGETFLGANGVEEGYLWTEPTWATTGKVANNILIKIKNTLEAQTDWSNYLKDGQYEEYKVLDMLDSSNVGNFSSMCEGCINLKRLPLLQGDNLLKVTNMFKGCSALEEFAGISQLGATCSITGNRLPSGYTERVSVTTVYESAASYIDLDLVLTSDSRFEMAWGETGIDYSATYGIFGSADWGVTQGKRSGNNLKWYWGSTSGVSTSSSLTSACIYNIKNTLYVCNVNKTQVLYTLTAGNADSVFTSNYPAYLWSRGGDVKSNSMRASIQYLKIWEKDELIRHMVAATNSSGESGMYDLINNKFYTPSGSAWTANGTKTPTTYRFSQDLLLDLSDCESLTKDSLISILNNLYTIPSTTDVIIPPRIILGETNLAKLTDAEKAIATNKGWVLE